MSLSWITPAGILFAAVEATYVEHPVVASSTSTVTYTIISGSLPISLDLSSTGTIHGTVAGAETEYIANFVVRATDHNNSKKDRTFGIIVPATTATPTPPVETTSVIDLGYIYSNDKCYIPVNNSTFNHTINTITYSVVDRVGANQMPPADLTVDNITGYLHGYVQSTGNYLENYSFVVETTATNKQTGVPVSAINTFTLGVYADNRDTIEWVTGNNLGTLEKGIISELSVKATTTDTVHELQYRLLPGESLPTGLELTTKGNITGYATTSGVFTATILASTGTYTDLMLDGIVYPYTFSTQEFTLNILPVPTEYTRMYVKPFLSIPVSTQFNNFISDTDIFVPSLIYRPEDPNFGVQTELRMYLEFGVERLNLADYTPILYRNFYKRTLLFGDVKIAKANDSNGNHIYDVIYVDIVDDINGAKPALSINNKIYYPGSIENMRSAIDDYVLPDFSTVEINENSLPRFMRTVQTAGTRETGYITTAVLCYALPGQGSKIRGRIRASKFDFKIINFEIDRIVVQNSLDHETAQYLIFTHDSITDQA